MVKEKLLVVLNFDLNKAVELNMCDYNKTESRETL